MRIHELLVLFGAGLAVVLARTIVRRSKDLKSLVTAPALAMLLQAGGGGAAAFGLWPLFLFFLKVGAILYGSGYVLLAFIRADLVERWHWLTETQLLDAIAVGQVTPGPVFTTATFIGYVLGGTRASSGCNTRNIPAGVLFCCGEWATRPTYSALGDGRSISRWR